MLTMYFTFIFTKNECLKLRNVHDMVLGLIL